MHQGSLLLIGIIAAGAVAAAAEAEAEAAPTVRVQPARAKPGGAVLVRVRGIAWDEGARAPAGKLGDDALHFYRVKGGWDAVGAVPLDYAAAPLVAKIDVPDGKAETIERSIEIISHTFPDVRLQVDDIYVDPPQEYAGQIAEDERLIARAFQRDAGEPLWRGRFRWPMKRTKVTGKFGDHRIFNGVKHSEHFGTDFEAPIGARIGAANAGEVVLARDCFFSGKTVLIRHGAGLYTAYFHLSEIALEVGQKVTRGQLVGRVGDTGRATGPHLHYGVRTGDRWVDPQAFMRLPMAPPHRQELAQRRLQDGDASPWLQP
jgi:murein DD-endopeptidase MepM/ murein hydrolase activator NlpD